MEKIRIKKARYIFRQLLREQLFAKAEKIQGKELSYNNLAGF